MGYVVEFCSGFTSRSTSLCWIPPPKIEISRLSTLKKGTVSKRKGSSSKHHFSGAISVFLRGVARIHQIKVLCSERRSQSRPRPRDQAEASWS